MRASYEDRQKAIATWIKSIPLVRFGLTLGAGIVSTTIGAVILFFTYLGVRVPDTSDAVMIAWINLLTVSAGIAGITNGVVVISIAFARLDKISITAPGGSGFALEMGDEPDEPVQPKTDVTVNVNPGALEK